MSRAKRVSNKLLRMLLRNPGVIPFAIVLALLAPAYAGDGSEETDRSSAGNGMYSTYIDTRSRFFSDDLGDAYPIEMKYLLPELLRAVDQLSKYPYPLELPMVRRVPHERIEELACGKKCAALAAYRSGEGIYIDESLKPETDIFARSVLLHELVHYVQDVANELASARPCDRWYRREQEAYAIQKRFLMLVGSQIRVGYSTGATCDHSEG